MNLLEKLQNTIFVKSKKNDETIISELENVIKKETKEVTEEIQEAKETKENKENKKVENIDEEAERQKDKQETKKHFKVFMNKEEREKYLSFIKTKLYYDKITSEDIEKLQNSMLDDWKKVVILIAIYNKQNNKNACIKIIKEAKIRFKNSEMKTKWLNKLQASVESKKAQNFDWNIYFDILKWKIDDELKQEIEEEIKKEQLQTQEKIRQEKENREKQILEAKLAAEERKRIKREEFENKKIEQERIKSIKAEERKKIIYNNKIKSVNNNIDDSNEKNKKEKKAKELKMNDLFHDEINLVRARACVAVSSEITDYKERENCIIDIDNLDEFGQKIVNLRSKMQFIMYMRKYGLSSKAENLLPKEYEIYEDLENLLLLKRAGEKFDNEDKIKKIKEKVDNIEGDIEFGYSLIEKILDRKDEVR